MIQGQALFAEGLPFPSPALTDRLAASIMDYVKYAQHPPWRGGSTLARYSPVACS